MKMELDLLRSRTPTYDEVTPTLLVHCRKMSNVSLNALIHDGILANSFVPLAECLMVAMTGITQLLLTLGLDPQVEDFVHASAELASTIRSKMDEALKFNNMDDVRICGVMTEVLVKGISVTLGLPYDTLFKAAVDGETDFTSILITSGHIAAPTSPCEECDVEFPCHKVAAPCIRIPKEPI